MNDHCLFSMDTPVSDYGMIRCRDRSCRVCYERFDLTYRFEPTILFMDRQIHRFVNQYSVYLNCNVVCIKTFIFVKLLLE